MSKKIRRRSFIEGLTLSAASLAGAPASTAFETLLKGNPPQSAAKQPERREFVVRNGYVMTMDARLGDIPNGDVHVKNGSILAVGKEIKAPQATTLDASHMIVLPGLVDTHVHMWSTLLRCLAGDNPETGYYPMMAACGKVMTSDDLYQGARLAAAEALYSGTTTVHDYCHNCRSREHAEANIRALKESGLRARWSYGWAQAQPNTQIVNLDDLEDLHRNWSGLSNGGLLSLGFGWRGMFRPGAILPPEVYRKEFETARKLGLPISLHVGDADKDVGQVTAHREFLGKDMQLIHVLSASQAEVEMIAAAGSSVSVSPGSDLRIGFGFTKTIKFLAAGIPVGVSIDTTALSGNASLFGMLKKVREIENATSHDEFKISAKRMLELGTIEGARSLGIDDRIGSLKPGKRADLILISTQHVNMGVFTDPAHLVVEATLPENVDTVVVDGRILKRGGNLTSLPINEILSRANTSLNGVRERANWRK